MQTSSLSALKRGLLVPAVSSSRTFDTQQILERNRNRDRAADQDGDLGVQTAVRTPVSCEFDFCVFVRVAAGEATADGPTDGRAGGRADDDDDDDAAVAADDAMGLTMSRAFAL